MMEPADEQLEPLIRDRLKAAFANVNAPQDLADRIRNALDEAAEPPEGGAKAKRWRALPIAPWLPRVLVAAAAVVLIAVPTWLLIAWVPAAQAREQLVRMHQRVVANEHLWAQRETDPEAIRQHLSEQLGVQAAAPVPKGRMCLCGCCIEKFHDHKVGAYAVDLPEGKVTVMVMAEPPSTFGANVVVTRGACEIRTTASDHCRIAAVRLGELYYYALGEVETEKLVDVLAEMCRSDQ